MEPGGVPGYTMHGQIAKIENNNPIFSRDLYGYCYRQTNGCSKTASYYFTIQSAVYSSNHITCNECKAVNGLADGSATVVPGGGIGALILFFCGLITNYKMLQHKPSCGELFSKLF